MKNIIRKKRKDNDFIIIISLAFGIALVLFLALTLAFFSTDKDVGGEITLGELDFQVFADSSTYDNIVPGQIFNKTISLINSRDVNGRNFTGLCNILVNFEVENELFIPIVDNQKWTKSGNVYYYNDLIAPSQVVDFFNTIQFSSDAGNRFQNNNIEIELKVNAIQAENDAYKELWQDAPILWKNVIESKI